MLGSSRMICHVVVLSIICQIIGLSIAFWPWLLTWKVQFEFVGLIGLIMSEIV